MRELITGSLAKAADNYAIKELGIPSLKLMDSAAEEVFLKAVELLGPGAEGKSKRIAVFAGVGNNGADGVLCAVKLIKTGYRNTRVYYVGKDEKATEEFKLQKEFLTLSGKNAEKLGADNFSEIADKAREGCDLVIDALFGIGLKREVKGEFLSCIELMNSLRAEQGARIISVDVPSGLDSDTGEKLCIMPVQPDVTVTFGYAKTGFYLNDGLNCCGEICVRDIGYPEDMIDALLERDKALEKDRLFMYERKDLAYSGLSGRELRANKSTYGRIVIAAGSKGMAGAAFLSGLAAYRAGAGMVRYLGPEENRVILQTLLPEAMYESLPEVKANETEEGRASRDRELLESIDGVLAWTGGRGAVVLGPGLSLTEEARRFAEAVIRKVYEYNSRPEMKGDPVSLIVDGDAITITAENPGLLKYMSSWTIMTPHIGEMARLTGKNAVEIKRDPVGTACEFFEDTGIKLILKDYISVIPERHERIFLNTSGTSALAKAGSGDVLSGLTAALTARFHGTEKAASLAAYIHGAASAEAARRYGLNGTLARDVADCIPEVMRSCGERA